MEDNIWMDALIDRAIICGVYRTEHEDSPRKCLHDILVWENATAIDPLVSSAARNLQGRARRVALEAAARKFIDKVDKGYTRRVVTYRELKVALEIPLDTEEEK